MPLLVVMAIDGGGTLMLLEFTVEEMEFLKELLVRIHCDILHEIHHTDRRAYRQLLRRQSEIVESLQKKLKGKNILDSSSRVVEKAV